MPVPAVNNFGQMRFLPFLLLMPLAVSAQNLPPQLQNAATSNGLIGMSVVTTCGAAVQDVVHTGKSNVALNINVTDSTRYRIASISKLLEMRKGIR